MARKTLAVTITEEGRDKGKVFVLTELPASQAEKWAARAVLALMKAGVDIPEGGGMAEIAVAGLKALGQISWELAEPLMDEMFACVKVMPDPGNASIVRSLIEDDIEEVTTRVRLRSEVFTLHTGFSAGAGRSTSISEPAPAASQNTRTSRARSAR